jgi:hypothetical protein
MLVDYLSNECKLFSQAKSLVRYTGEDIDQLLRLARGLDPLLGHLRRFDAASHRFETFHDLVPALEESVTSSIPHASNEDRRSVVDALSGTQLFRVAMEAGSFEVTGEDLDLLLYEVRGLDQLLVHLRKFDKAKRQFKTFHDLVPAVKAAEMSHTHISDEARTALLDRLSSPECKLFSEEGLPAFTGEDMDNLLVAAQGLPSLMTLLDDFEANGYQFPSFHDLVPAVQAAMADGGPASPPPET